MGSAARVKVLNMKRGIMRGITDLPKPTLRDGVVAGEADRSQCLLPAAAFAAYQRGAGRKHTWDNYFSSVCTPLLRDGRDYFYSVCGKYGIAF